MGSSCMKNFFTPFYFPEKSKILFKDSLLTYSSLMHMALGGIQAALGACIERVMYGHDSTYVCNLFSNISSEGII